MPKLLFDFKCEEGHVTSEFIDTSIKNISCDCGKPAKRLISSPHFPLRQGLDLDMTAQMGVLTSGQYTNLYTRDGSSKIAKTKDLGEQ